MQATLQAECDVSVSRLPGLETFAIFLIVSVSVSENLVSEKKVSVSVSKNLVSEKKSRYRYRKIWSRKKVSVLVSNILVSDKKFAKKNCQK